MKKQKIPKLNLELFFDNYSENLLNVSLAQRQMLDIFREKEEELKEYIKQVSLLEKTKNNYKMKDFEKIISNIAINLAEEFSNLDMPLKNIFVSDNVKKINGIILGIKNRGYEFENIANKFNNIKKLWIAFIKPREYLDKNAKFIRTIEEELLILSNDIKEINIDDIGRIEENIASLKELIEKAIYAISEMEILYNNYFFVGYEAEKIKKNIEKLLDREYKDLDIGKLVIKVKQILEEKKKIIVSNKTVTEKIHVVYIKEKENKKVNTYGFYINGVYLNPSEIEFKDPEYIFLKQYIYVDNFPISGIFEKKWLIENLDISQNQLLAMEKFSAVSMKKFLIGAVGGSIFAWILYATTPIFNLITFIFSVLGIHLFFAWNFRSLKKKIDKEFNVPDAFYFIPINYVYIKEGTDKLKYEKLPMLILKNFEKIFNSEEKDAE